jgi:hypothetical protein
MSEMQGALVIAVVGVLYPWELRNRRFDISYDRFSVFARDMNAP